VATKALSCQPSDYAGGNTKGYRIPIYHMYGAINSPGVLGPPISLIIDFRSHRTHCLPCSPPKSPSPFIVSDDQKVSDRGLR